MNYFVCTILPTGVGLCCEIYLYTFVVPSQSLFIIGRVPLNVRLSGFRYPTKTTRRAKMFYQPKSDPPRFPSQGNDRYCQLLHGCLQCPTLTQAMKSLFFRFYVYRRVSTASFLSGCRGSRFIRASRLFDSISQSLNPKERCWLIL